MCHKNAFENIVCSMTAILFKSQFDKLMIVELRPHYLNTWLCIQQNKLLNGVCAWEMHLYKDL